MVYITKLKVEEEEKEKEKEKERTPHPDRGVQCNARAQCRGHLPYRKVQRSVANLNLVFECYIISRPRLWAVTFTSDELGTERANPHPNR